MSIRKLAVALACAVAVPAFAQTGLAPVLAEALSRQGVDVNSQARRVPPPSLLKAVPSVPAAAPLRKQWVDGVMVRFDDPGARAEGGAPPPALAALVLQASGYKLKFRRAMSLGMHVFSFDQALDIADALPIVQRLRATAGIAAVDLDVRVGPRLVPNDAFFHLQHNMRAPATFLGGIDAVGAWDITTGSPSVVVAILDTGITPHADFAGRLIPGYDFVADGFSANDGDGRDGNAADPGDWVTAAEARANGCDAHDSSWHGTHVAGIFGATGNNGTGVAGVDWRASILPLRVLGKCGGRSSDTVDAMLWAAGFPVQGVPNNPRPAQILNMSLGVYSPEGCTATFQNVIRQVKSRSVLIVVAAGNESDEAASYVPASCSGVVTVGATDQYGFQSLFSNYSDFDKVAISAPGGDSYWGDAALIPSTFNTGLTGPGQDAYIYREGTSMAAPHVAGVASLALSVNGELSAFELAALLQVTSHDFHAESICTKYWPLCGSGIADANRMVRAATALLPFRIVSEFFNPDYKHYFRTGDRAEPAIVESGALGNWQNTEEYFIAWRDATQGASPVCRFYSSKFNSHFYTVNAAECEAVKRNPDWGFEGISFFAKVPTNGVCPADTTPIWRFYNNRHNQNDGNHRLTPFGDFHRATLVAQGWIDEGVAMCGL
jgi:serine protease